MKVKEWGKERGRDRIEKVSEKERVKDKTIHI